MITLTSLLLAGALARQDAPVTLERKFTKGETHKYQVRSHLLLETTETGQPVALPEEVSFEYDFTTKVTDVQESGFATVEYRRPALVQIDGETFDKPPRSHNLLTDEKVALTISPINEVSEARELKAIRFGSGPVQQLASLPYATQLYQMAVMIGGPDSSIDFNPKLPFEPVAPGATWKKTVNYTPQNLKGDKSGKQAVQRVDMTYTYVGRQTMSGREYVRVRGNLNLDTDMTRYVADSMGVGVGQSPVKGLQVKLNVVVDFDLDPVTLATFRAKAKSNGSYLLQVQRGDRTLQVEQKITGTNSLKQI